MVVCGIVTCKFHIKGRSEDQNCVHFLDRKCVALLDFLNPGQPISSDHYISMLKLKVQMTKFRPVKIIFHLKYDIRPVEDLQSMPE